MNPKLLSCLGLAGCLVAAGTAAHAQAWPTKTVTMVVPFAPGGSTDATARLLAQRLGQELGQQVIVENKAGAGSNIGSAYAARASADGYTVLFASSAIAANMSLYRNPGFDLRKDLKPVSQVAWIPNVLTVNTQFPATSLQQFVDHVQQRKSDVNYGSAGSGSASHLSGALFNSMANGSMQHVAYRGGAPANADLMGGQVQAVFSPLVEVLPFIEGGSLRALGVTTQGRAARLPDVPAIAEALPGFEVALWNGVFVPAGTPPAVVDTLAQAIGRAVSHPALSKTLTDQGSTPVGNAPAAFEAIVAQEIDKWARLVEISGAAVD